MDHAIHFAVPEFDGKVKMATWLVSKCHTSGQREKYVSELQKHVDIEVFGRCGLKPILPRSKAAYHNLLPPYFFYLSFENTRCKDYISEKFYNVYYSSAAVPVVFGPPKKDYEAVAPPHSFLHISDFANAQALADYMHYLARNLTAYAEYFWWTTFYKVRETDRACSLCDKLQQIRSGHVKTHRIPDFNHYWTTEADCNNPDNAPWT